MNAQMETMTTRIVDESLARLRAEYEWREMEAEVAQRLPELCRDTVVAARLARFRRVQASLLDTPLCQCPPGECQGH